MNELAKDYFKKSHWQTGFEEVEQKGNMPEYHLEMELWRSAVQKQKIFSCQLGSAQGLGGNRREGERLLLIRPSVQLLDDDMDGQLHITQKLCLFHPSALHSTQTTVKRMSGTWKVVLKNTFFLCLPLSLVVRQMQIPHLTFV